MIRRILLSAGLPSLLVLVLAAAAAAGVAVPNTRQFEFTSKVNGHRYHVSVALPYTSAPSRGYAVLYVLDGYWYFASATEATRLAIPQGVVIVGIGYPDDRAYVQSVLARRGPVAASIAYLPASRIVPFLERTYDLTLPASDEDLAAQTLAGNPKQRSENVGGLDDFLKTIEIEIKPRVAAMVPVDAANQALFGHSYGGLAALHALFVEPNAFHSFIIGSPSIWWNNRKVLADEATFAAAVSAGQAGPRVLVTMGGEESTPPKVLPVNWGVNRADLEVSLRRIRMVENGAELVARLKALRGNPSYVIGSYAVFDDEGHSAAAWSALARGIPFAFDADN